MKDSRINEMKDYIEQMGTVSMEALCGKFNVSIATVRRDINELVQGGAIEKIYGGVRKKARENLIEFQVREVSNIEAKTAIGCMAAELLCDQDIIFIDSGTTTAAVIDYLTDKAVTIVTSSLEVIEKAVEYENIKLICLTGIYNKATNSFAGIDTSESLNKYNLTKALMAASGVTIESGLTHASPWEYDIKTAAVEKAGEVILMVDHTKFDTVTLVTYCSLNHIDKVVTDVLPADKFVRFFAENGIELKVSNGRQPAT